jgi:cytidylate kinase
VKKIIIAIDGFSSCGKSTLAKQLAKELNYTFVDSGAMYRAITLFFLREHIDWNNTDNVKEVLQNISLDFEYNEATNASDMILNYENLESLIRYMLVSENVSSVPTMKEVL